MNALHIMRVLAHRLEVGGFHAPSLRLDVDGHAWVIETTSPVGKQQVLLCGWQNADGTLKDVLSFVLPPEGNPIHLNRWVCPRSLAGDVLDDLWDTFWGQEQANTVKWMVEHLPSMHLDPLHSEQPHNVFDLFAP